MKITRTKLSEIIDSYKYDLIYYPNGVATIDSETLEDIKNDIMVEINKKEAPKIKEFDTMSNEYKLARYLEFEIIENRKKLGLKPMAEPDLQQWAKQIDLMIRVDKLDPHEIKDVIDWCQQDDFWKTNILSTLKLRKHYVKLAFMMASNRRNNNKSNIRTVKYDRIS
jgi:hypothetical protein